MHGIRITEGPSDWEILQQKNGFAEIEIKGTYKVHQAALDVGVVCAYPIVRVMREDDNMTVIPWTKADEIQEEEGFQGSFKTTLKIPAGGMYRIDTSLETRSKPESTAQGFSWLYRGDCILHIGVGNLFIIAGQSNSAGYSRDFCMDPPHMSVHLYRNRSRWDLASHPMNESTDAGSLPNEEMGIPGVSPYLSFGKRYAEITGMPVGFVQTSLGGSAMRQWKPGSGELYQNMVDKIQQTRGAYAGVLWYQGCSDTNSENPDDPMDFSPAIHYLEHFKELVEAVRKEVGYEIPFFTMQLNRQINGINDAAWGMVREAQKKAAEEISNVYVLSTTNLSLSDGIHNSAGSNVALGEKLAKQCAFVLNQEPEYQAPVLIETGLAGEQKKQKLHLEGIWLELKFAHVQNCLMIFSSKGEDSGFLLEDAEGIVKIKNIRANREDKNRAYLELERMPKGTAFLSFAWEADPVKLPMLDEVTFLPPLSFYKNEISYEEICD